MSYLNRWGLLDKVLASTPSHTVVNLVNEGIPLAGEVPMDLLRSHFKEMHEDDSGVVQRYASVRRQVLDQILIEAAAEAGAEVRQGFTVEDLMYDGEQVVGVRGRTRGGDRVEERARVVVGADGRNSLVARALKLPKLDQRPKCTFAYWSDFSGFDPTTAHLHRRGRMGMAVVPTNFGRNMTLVWGPSEWSREFRSDIGGNFHKALDFVSPETGELVRTSGSREERFYGTLDQAAFLRPLFGPGWVLVGDAECFKDQCTATGMTYAFRDAELASAGLHSWLAGEQPMDQALSRYRSRRRSQNAAAYYDYTCTLAEMQTLRHDELQLRRPAEQPGRDQSADRHPRRYRPGLRVLPGFEPLPAQRRRQAALGRLPHLRPFRERVPELPAEPLLLIPRPETGNDRKRETRGEGR